MDVLTGDVDGAVEFVRVMGVALLMDALAALAIIVVALFLAGWAKRTILKMPERSDRLDPTLAAFFANIAKYLILIIAGIAVLSTFGVQTTSLAAVIGAAGLAIGLALQGTLGHLAAGVLLAMFRPFKVGDFIETGGESGTVKEISLLSTELATTDNVQIFVPNGAVFAASIKNFSAHPERRVDMVFGVSYDTDLKAAETILKDLIAKDDRILKTPAPFAKVTNLGDFSVDFTVRIWCKAGDYWDLKFDFTRGVKEAFDEGGIDIPFPTALELTKQV